MLEGPKTEGVTIEDNGECVITPSTDVKFSGRLKEKHKLNYWNDWLLIGVGGPAWLHVASLVPYQLQPSTGVFRAESCSRNVKFCSASAEGGRGGPFPECAHHSGRRSAL